ncbi:isopeptide-forming domain-containing fimbrial protein [Clostridium sardiniense]|uniref:Isopeptide-forming domain-containing fimbrial protein n=2 Tax=Clostridium sardiniense TaxID=29369 RepID=A0ABS7KZS4_CLOSR|nr:isopeptide-forming domain-containing fimbrial protein [Clostridium sardiniense]
MTTSFLPVVAHADNVKQEVTFAFNTKATPNGIADFGKGKASITINGNNGNQVLIGKKFNVYKLFNAQNSTGGDSINYTVNPEYAQALKNIIGKYLNKTPNSVTEYEIIDYIQSLNNNKVEGANHNQANEGRYSDFRYFVEDLRNEIVRLGIKSDVVDVTEVRKDNSIQLTGLEFGYYIVDEVSAVAGTHSASSLCMVNTANPNVTMQVKSDFPTVIKKIKEDDNISSVGDNGWNDIGDFEVGQTVPYKFESNVPNMNGYHTYYYAWHDKMDEALTFNKDSVSIKISDEIGKSYTLKNNEFNVIEKPGNGETFKVEIKDIKSIVDREFNKKNSLGENVYGQKVTLSYNATLNDKASNDTGRPGFENDVKLEFSNNPDGDGNGSTGETPWDTVVCFTYKINGLKVNDNNVKLENAKFRLYSDKECKNEVYVKKGANGYIVINRDSATNGVPKEAVEMVSNEKGEFNIIGLDQGTYYLKETQAPNGYRPLLDPIEISIVPTFTKDRNSYIKGYGATDKTLQRLDATAKVKGFWGGIFNEDNLTLDTNVSDGSLNVTVINKVESKLPATGSTATLYLVGIGSVLMAGSIVLLKKSKKK